MNLANHFPTIRIICETNNNQSQVRRIILMFSYSFWNPYERNENKLILSRFSSNAHTSTYIRNGVRYVPVRRSGSFAIENDHRRTWAVRVSRESLAVETNKPERLRLRVGTIIARCYYMLRASPNNLNWTHCSPTRVAGSPRKGVRGSAYSERLAPPICDGTNVHRPFFRRTRNTATALRPIRLKFWIVSFEKEKKSGWIIISATDRNNDSSRTRNRTVQV